MVAVPNFVVVVDYIEVVDRDSSAYCLEDSPVVLLPVAWVAAELDQAACCDRSVSESRAYRLAVRPEEVADLESVATLPAVAGTRLVDRAAYSALSVVVSSR